MSNTPSMPKLVPIAAKPIGNDGKKKSDQIINSSSNGSNKKCKMQSPQRKKIPQIVPNFQQNILIAPRSTLNSGKNSKEGPAMIGQLQTTPDSSTSVQTTQTAPIPIAPRLSKPSTSTAKLRNVEGSPVPATATNSQSKQPPILPKMTDKPQQSPSTSVANNPANLIMNGYGILPQRSTIVRLPNQSSTFGLQLNQALRLQMNGNANLTPGSPQALQMQQLQMNIQFLQQQQQQQNLAQQNGSIFPQRPQFIPQLMPNPTSSNASSMPMFMISNQPRSQFPPNYLASVQGSQMTNPVLHPLFAKPIASGTSTETINGALTTTTSSQPTIPSLLPSSNGTTETGDKKNGGNGSDDEENEPPPLLFRDETMSSEVNDVFIQEGAALRRALSPEIITHVIDGFEIEESDTPFEVDRTEQKALDLLKKVQAEIQADLKNDENTNGHLKAGNLAKSPASRSRKSDSVQRPSSTKSTTKSPKSDHSPSVKTNRELARLLSMDFGKNTPFKTTSPEAYMKEVKRQTTLLRPSIQMPDYNERDSPRVQVEEDSTTLSAQNFVELSNELCLNCQKTFAELGQRNKKSPQYCSKECRREYKQSRRNRAANKRSVDSSLDSSGINEDLEISKKSKQSLSNEYDEEPSTSTERSPTLKIKVKSPTRDSAPIPSPTASIAGSEYLRPLEQAGLDPADVANWGPEEVQKFVNSITNSTNYGGKFKDEEIDGSSLLILDSGHLKLMDIRLGPALKIGKAIEWLKNYYA